METVGIISISGKPFHLGHFKLIEKAAHENEQVILYVSLSDRIRKNEIPIYGQDMEVIWETQLLDIMPHNVQVMFVRDESPIRKIYALLGEAQEANGTEKYIIYSDSNDIVKNFPEKSINKYFKDLMGDGRLSFKSISRDKTSDISGTKMREFLELNQKDLFCKYLPNVKNKEEIWNLLRKKAKREILKNIPTWNY